MKEGGVYEKDRVFRKRGEVTEISRNRKRNKKSTERRD